MPAPLVLFNSLGRKLEEFVPLSPGRARLYTCGLTVYDYAHIGNLRAYLFTDSLRRVLQWKGYDVLHVMNITDVGHLTSDADVGEDKVESAAQRRGMSVWDITAYYTRDFQENLVRLGILPPSVLCKATDHIQEMIAFAEHIHERGYTYVLGDGLYFDTSKVADYGRLGLLDVEGQQAGARVEMQEGKRNPSDFAVWRFSPADKQRLMEWRSPWGTGAPGWHLECSVMSLKYLGAPFDIHTGGIDHRQVHHVNEIAQNQAWLGSEDSGVRTWMHNEFLVLGEEKMSKSKGGFIRLQTVMDWGIHPLVYRWFVLQAHYRKALDFSLDGLVAARTGLVRLLRRIAEWKAQSPMSWKPLVDDVAFSRGGSFRSVIAALSEGFTPAARRLVEELDAALSDDLNTAQAVALLSGLAADKGADADEALRLVAIADLALGMGLLGLAEAELNLRPAAAAFTEAEVEAKLAERESARAAKDWARSDALRKELAEGGVAVFDGKSRVGPAWEWLPRKAD